MAVGIALTVVPTASAEPDDAVEPGPPGPGVAAVPAADSADANAAAVAACSQFAGALNLAASYYSDFANNISGDAPPNYQDPIVRESNVYGRTAVREAAAAAMSASTTPGLAPDIANPMRAWSFDATKLLVLMGLRAPRDTINAKANDINNDTQDAQMACAAAGTHA
jgi:hypothetical protein